MKFVLISQVFFLNFGLIDVFSQRSTGLTLELLYDQIKSLTEKYPDTSSLVEIGRSVENRPIYVVKIQKGLDQGSTVVVELGIHGREVASVASGLYFLEKLLKNSHCSGLVERIRWYVIPVLNPDGYKYAVDTGELWRKNRASIRSSACLGIDLNRNFPVGWENRTNPYYYCQETFCGRMPFSEPESTALKKFLDNLIGREAKAYLAVHTCASGMFYPYGYKREKAGNHVELEKVGRLMQSAIRKVAGTVYRVGPAYELGLGGGGVDEWVYDTYQIPLVYTFELGGAKTGKMGSSLDCFFPPSGAVTGRLIKEFFAGVESLASYICPDALDDEDRALCLNYSKQHVKTTTKHVPNHFGFRRVHAVRIALIIWVIDAVS